MTDGDGNRYDYVSVGEQEWLSENLRSTSYRDGTPIPNVEEMSEWAEQDGPAYSWYENDLSLGDAYGALYNWYAVDGGELCPAGWRVPDREEWEKLEAYLDEENRRIKLPLQVELSPESRESRRVNMSEESIRAEDETPHPRWYEGGTDGAARVDGEDEYGFAALPAGFRSSHGDFVNVGLYTGWWSADEEDEILAWYLGMPFNYPGFYDYESRKTMGFSVRCMRDRQ